ncbi:MinD/ParA family protein [Vulgatibacter sp.]|uniref:MinD/ParA family protein n=1 Tax=Vulgatibacter sp. TaxID=1971226 RepID=UPI0035682012
MDPREEIQSLLGGEPLRVIAVTSGKGGVGKSTISTNLAVLVARAGSRVLLVDADLGLANADILLGIRPRHHLGDVLRLEVPVRDVLAEGPHGIRVLSAGSGLQHLTQLAELEKLRLLGALDELEEEFDFVIVDSPAGIGDNVLFFVGAAQEALLVVSPEPTSLTDAYAAVKALSQSAGVRHFDVLVNPAASEAQAREVFGKLEGITRRFLEAQLSYAGHLPRDENVHRAVMSQRPVVDAYPLSPVSRALEGVVANLLRRPPPTRLDGGLKFLWHRLMLESAARARA